MVRSRPSYGSFSSFWGAHAFSDSSLVAFPTFGAEEPFLSIEATSETECNVEKKASGRARRTSAIRLYSLENMLTDTRSRNSQGEPEDEMTRVMGVR